jgi:nucleotide-binding universal stress UspA family protein
MRSPLATLVVGVDFSQRSEYAARRVLMLAGPLLAERVVLQHAMPALRDRASMHMAAAGHADTSGDAPATRATAVAPVSDRGSARPALCRLAQRLRSHAQVAVETEARAGTVVEVLRKAAHGADLVALGAPGAHPMRDLVLGATAQRLMRRVPVPLLAVRQAPTRPYGRVLVALDFAHDPARLLELAAALAPGVATLTVVRTYRSAEESRLEYSGVEEATLSAYRQRAATHARAHAGSVLASCADPDVTAVVVHGHETRALLGQARASAADLIVIARRGASPMERLLIDSVDVQVLEGAHCDVLVVP